MSIAANIGPNNQLKNLENAILNTFQTYTNAHEVSQKIMPLFVKFQENISNEFSSLSAKDKYKASKIQIESIPTVYLSAYTTFKSDCLEKYLLMKVANSDDLSIFRVLPKELLIHIAQLAISHIPLPDKYNLDEIGEYFAHNCHFPLGLI